MKTSSFQPRPVRPSQRGMLRLCPSSQAPGYQIGIAGEHIAAGVAVDEILTGFLAGVLVTPGRVVDVAARHGADHAEVCARVDLGLSVLGSLGDLIGPDPQVQTSLDGPMGRGTPDLFARDLVLDWKSREGDHWDQVTHYAHSLRHMQGGIDGDVTMVLVWLATGIYEIRHIDDAGLDAWEDEQRRLESQIGTVYRPDPGTCPRCSRRHDCRAREDQTRTALAVLGPRAEGCDIVSVEDAAARYPAVQQLEKYIETYRSVLKSAVLSEGPIDIGDGRELAVVDVVRRTVDPSDGARLLMDEGWTREDVDTCTTLTAGKIEKQAAAKAARGGKKAAGRRVMDTLTAQDAVTTTTSRVLKLRKVRDDD